MPYTVYIRDSESGVYHCTVTGAPGSGIRVRKSTGTRDRAIAEEYAHSLEQQMRHEAVYGRRAVVTYAEAAESYLDLKDPATRDRRAIANLIRHFGTSKLVEITGENAQTALDDATKALASHCAPGGKERSVKIPHTAILRHAARRGWCSAPTFEAMERGSQRTDWLMPPDAVRLIDAAAQHLRPLIVFLLGTGARVGEALALDWDSVDLQAGTAVFWEDTTKAGKKRVAKLSPLAVTALANLPHRTGAVFRRPDGEPYAEKGDEGGGEFRTAWRAACRRARLIRWLPAADSNADHTPVRCVHRYTPHHLRHTWATYWQAACDRPSELRDEGGWSSVTLVERYAHQMKLEDVPSIALVWGCAHPHQFPAHLRRIPGAISAATLAPQKPTVTASEWRKPLISAAVG